MLFSSSLTMHWAKTLGSKQSNLLKPTAKNENDSFGGFSYNATKYELSEEKQLWDRIWDEAMNHSLANRNSTFTQNIYMQKTRLLDNDDVMTSPVHPHSFTMVMVIASMFLFFTLAITIGVIVLCRKKNMVFALQKSEQEDDGEYEMDDIESNTDMEEESDTEDDEEAEEDNSCPNPAKKHRHYIQVHKELKNHKKKNGQYLRIQNPPSTFKFLGMDDTIHNKESEDSLSNTTPIYRPSKKPLKRCDKRGAYQAIDSNCKGETQNNALPSDTNLCPCVVIIPQGAVTSRLETDNVTCKNQTLVNVPNNQCMSRTELLDSVSVINETLSKGQIDIANDGKTQICTSSYHCGNTDDVHNTVSQNTIKNDSRSNNDLKESSFICDKYETEICLLSSCVDYINESENRFSDTPVVLLKGKTVKVPPAVKSCDKVTDKNGHCLTVSYSNIITNDTEKPKDITNTKNHNIKSHSSTKGMHQLVNNPCIKRDLNLNSTHNGFDTKQLNNVPFKHMEIADVSRCHSDVSLCTDKDCDMLTADKAKPLTSAPQSWVTFEDTVY